MQIKMKIGKTGKVTYEVLGGQGANCLPIAAAMERIATPDSVGELCMKPEGEFAQAVAETQSVGGGFGGEGFTG